MIFIIVGIYIHICYNNPTLDSNVLLDSTFTYNRYGKNRIIVQVVSFLFFYFLFFVLLLQKYATKYETLHDDSMTIICFTRVSCINLFLKKVNIYMYVCMYTLLYYWMHLSRLPKIRKETYRNHFDRVNKFVKLKALRIISLIMHLWAYVPMKMISMRWLGINAATSKLVTQFNVDLKH